MRKYYIQVSGLNWFNSYDYRKMFRYFLTGVRKNRSDVMYRPKIDFGSVTLRLDQTKKRYYIYSSERRSAEVTPFHFAQHEVLDVWCSQWQVDHALWAFVHDASIKKLVIRFPKNGRLFLWKNPSGNCVVAHRNAPDLMGRLMSQAESGIRSESAIFAAL